MKKTYKNPTLTVVKIQPSHILAGSDIAVGQTYGTNGQKTVLSRQGSFSGWTEEEE